MEKKIILATTSPYRKAAFEMLGIPFEAIGSNVEEYFDGRPDDPEALVLHLAKLKAEAVAQGNKGASTIIGFDSVGWFDGKVLEKPQTREEMLERLRAMSGNRYQFYTGIHIIDFSSDDGQKILSKAVKTDIVMRNLTDAEINWYLDQDPNFKTYAQGYDPLGTYGSTFIKEIHGSYNNPLRGIPLEVIVEMLKEVGWQI
ncbi:MAG: Maf family nucleotide pyrophosphatase [Candidatus Moranbacteria bacterium]|nr:Maf family nucleotide pyrophosphatase [Candidatus Moranbacteria bacterium]